MPKHQYHQKRKKAKHIFSYKQEEVAVTHSGIPKSMLEIFSVFFQLSLALLNLFSIVWCIVYFIVSKSKKYALNKFTLNNSNNKKDNVKVRKKFVAYF